MPEGIAIALADFTAAEAGIREVREAVFVHEQHVPLELEWDGRDAGAVHVVATDADNKVIGTGRLLADGHIGRMAVLPQWRTRGIGSAMLDALCQAARAQGIERVFLAAQIHAVGFYARHGFATFGEEFMDAGIPHRNMERSAGGTSR